MGLEWVWSGFEQGLVRLARAGLKRSSYLDVVFGNEPGPVGQNLVDFVQVQQFRGDVVQSQKPTLVAIGQHKLAHLLLDQITASVTTCRLHFQKKRQERNRNESSIGL